MSGTYAIDARRSRIGFVARHAVVSRVRGSFREYVGTGYLDDERPASSHLSLTIDAASIDTGNAERDRELRSNDFLDMGTYPQIVFASTAVSRRGSSTYRVTGDLTIKAVTRPVTVDFELTETNAGRPDHRIRLTGSTTINRKDWGVVWSPALEAGGLLVGDTVTLEFDVSAVRVDAPSGAERSTADGS